MISPYFNLLAPVFSLLASYFYIKSILKGETIPNKMGWFIWIIAPFVSFIIMIQHGGGWSALSVCMSWFVPLLVFIASFWNKKSYWKVSFLDILCLISALASIYLWIVAKDIYTATVFSIIADGFGFIPTIVKTWGAPETERPWPYLAGFVNALLSLLSLHQYNFYLYGFPFYVMLGNLILILIIYRKLLFKK